MKQPDELDRLLSGLAAAPPPPEARARTLAAARAAQASGTQPADIWWRLWTSRPLRVVWAAAVLGLIAANVVLSLHRPEAGAAPGAPVTAARHGGPDPDLAAVAQLPPLDLDLLPRFGASGGSHATTNQRKPS